MILIVACLNVIWGVYQYTLKEFDKIKYISKFWKQIKVWGYRCKSDGPIWITSMRLFIQGVPKKHGNSVTNSISSLLWISIVIPNFNSDNIIMSARVYFMKRVNECVCNVSARWTVKMDKFTKSKNYFIRRNWIRH